jgi:glycolate oxidase
MVSESILQELRRIVGDAHVDTGAETIRENSTDATKAFHAADAIVFPEKAEQVSLIVKLANREKIPIVSRGGGVGFAGGAIPVRGGIVISKRGINRVLEVNPVDLLADLHKAAEAKCDCLPKPEAALTVIAVFANVRRCAEAANLWIKSAGTITQLDSGSLLCLRIEKLKGPGD